MAVWWPQIKKPGVILHERLRWKDWRIEISAVCHTTWCVCRAYRHRNCDELIAWSDDWMLRRLSESVAHERLSGIRHTRPVERRESISRMRTKWTASDRLRVAILMVPGCNLRSAPFFLSHLNSICVSHAGFRLSPSKASIFDRFAGPCWIW